MLLKKNEFRAYAAVILCVATTAVFAADYNITSGKTVITDAEIAGCAGKSFDVPAGAELEFSVALASAVRLGAVSGAGTVTIANTGASRLYFGSLKDFTGNMSGSGFGFGDAWSTTVNLNGKVTGAASVNSYNYGLKFWGTNVLPSDFVIRTGHQASPQGNINLQGYDQEVGSLIFTGSAYSTAVETDPRYDVTSTDKATLTVNGEIGWNPNFYPAGGGLVRFNEKISLCYRGTDGVTSVLRGASTTAGGFFVESGTLAFSPTFTATKLSTLLVSGTGKVILETAEINPDVDLVLDGVSASLESVAPLALTVKTFKLDGAYVRPASYTADEISELTEGRIGGIALTVKDRVIGEVTTFTWTGGGADGSLATDSNWKGGVAPKLKGGNEILDFSEGTNATVPSGVNDVYGIVLSAGTAFELKDAGDAKLFVGAGGVAVGAPESGMRTLTLSVVPQLAAPQTWSLLASTKVVLMQGWAGASDVTETGTGTLEFANDVVPLFGGKLTMASGAKAVISGCGGIGSLGSSVILSGTAGLSVTAACATNRADITFGNGSTQSWAPAGTEFYQLGAAINSCGGAQNSNFNVDGKLHLKGGVTCAASHISSPSGYMWWWWHFCINPKTGEAWIEDKPLNVGACGIIFGNRNGGCGKLHLDAANNVYGRIVLSYDGRLVCGVADALCATGDIFNYATWTGALDLGGHDQTIRNLLMNNDTNGQPSGAGAVGYNGQILSATPAVLTITGAEACSPAAFKFVDKAALAYAGTGSLSLTKEASTSVGPLKVSSGEVRLRSGASWANCTNVVVSGTGKLTLETAVAQAKAFSPDAVVDISGDGLIEIPTGETVTVGWLNVNGKPAYKGRYSDEFVTGGGTLHVLKSILKRGMMLIFK